MRAEVVISEFMASNDTTLKDDFGDDADWIELHNTGGHPVDLGGWRLTDNASNLSKWVFPPRVIQPGEYLIVFATSRDRKTAGQPLHTNFALSAGGEYLALLRPDGGKASEFAPFPPQATDISYGIPQSTTEIVVPQGSTGRVGVPVSAADYSANFAGWTANPGTFAGSSWQDVRTGIGFDDPEAAYGALIHPEGEISARLRNQQRTACLRIPFHVGAPDTVISLRLRMKYDDGFIAWINGVQIAADAAPASPQWNSLATQNRNEALNNDWTDFTIPAGAVPLHEGQNLLAVQGFNVTTGSSDFLILPVLEAVSLAEASEATYFTTPTPGAPNGSGGPIGPRITDAVASIPRPLGNAASPPAVVTAAVARTVFDIAPATVKMFHRTMFGPETGVILADDGVPPDAAAGDGIYTGLLPTASPAPGQMLRWRFEATDVNGNIGRLPAYLDPEDYDQYFGTVAENPAEAASELQVIHQFVANETAAGTRAGTRCSLFFLGRFYDNIHVNLHGQSTASFAKKSQNLDFNTDNRFTWNETAERKVKDVDLLSNHADKTRTRNAIAHETARLAGAVHHFAFPVRVQRNGSFHGVMDMVEDGDDRMLERNGLDPDGALYKMYDALASTSGGEKKTRKDEDKSDLQELITALDPSVPLGTRRRFAYDRVDLPATVNYLSTRVINNDRDHGHKNYYLYRDTNGSREWLPVMWDADLSWGRNYSASADYFDDTLYSNPITVQTPNNRLYRIVWESPELRAMYLRRLRTLMDEILGQPGTVDGWPETFMRDLAASIDPDPANPSPWTDGDLDFVKWGTWGRGLRPREEVEYVIANYIGQHRTWLYNQGAGRQRYGPSAEDIIPDHGQTETPGMIVFDSLDFHPASGSQAEEYLILRNTTVDAVDLSGWTLSGAIEHVFPGGTVIPPGDGSPVFGFRGLLHVAKDALAFRNRPAGPTGGEFRLVQGGYSGQLPARGGSVVLRARDGQIIAVLDYLGEPTAHQAALRITEIQYHPAPLSATEQAAFPGLSKEEFEFLELTNFGDTPLDLGGTTFTDGIVFTFPPVSLSPGSRLLLAKNPAAFALRYPHITTPVLGPYEGQLDNAGERLELADPTGEIILAFEYRDGWYPATDGSGRSLVLRDEGTPGDAFDSPLAWAISAEPLGTPGDGDTAFAQTYFGWDHFHFTPAERDDPSVSAMHADADGDGRTNWEEYALGTDPRLPDQPLISFAWADGRPALRFRRPANALDVSYELLAADTLADTWPVTETEMHSSTPAEPGIEEIVLKESGASSPPRRFFRLRYLPIP